MTNLELRNDTDLNLRLGAWIFHVRNCDTRAVHWDDRGIDPDGSFAEIEILLLSPSGSGGQGPENRFQSRNHRNSQPFTGIATNIKDPTKTGNAKLAAGRKWEKIFHGKPYFSLFGKIFHGKMYFSLFGNDLKQKLRFESDGGRLSGSHLLSGKSRRAVGVLTGPPLLLMLRYLFLFYFCS